MRAPVDEALEVLGIESLVLAIHDLSFPSYPDEDIGRGSPYSRGGYAFLAFARELGFNGIQLGPQGETSPGNPSPYDGSVFSKNMMSLALGPRAETVSEDRRVQYAHAYRVQHAVRLEPDGFDPPWLQHDALFEALAVEHGTDDWRRWPASYDVEEIARRRRDVMDAYRGAQRVLHQQHAELRAHARALGLLLYGDLQIGLSLRDTWARDDLFLRGFWMGAPPSRTNPDGQPWGYPVFDPQSYALAIPFLKARADKLMSEFDGVRIDHPHGLVCPWVYDATSPSPQVAVAHGARLFESPDHPQLGPLAIARADQIDPSRPPYADDWVTHLDDAQIDRYAALFDVLARGKVLCEVLSTCPRPLGMVMDRYGLGRFRVTQKAKMHDPTDVYRSENAAPADWIMIGNHDTEPLLLAIDRWDLPARAAYLSKRLKTEVAPTRREVAEAMVADLFVGPAKHVMVFWADLYGERDIYNRPGVVDPDNWTMRVPRDFRRVYEERRAAGEAIDLTRALATALRARGLAPDLAQRLQRWHGEREDLP